MLKDVKAYWRNLKTQYEDRYGEPFLDDYDHSVEYFEKMEIIFLKRKKGDRLIWMFY